LPNVFTTLFKSIFTSPSSLQSTSTLPSRASRHNLMSELRFQPSRPSYWIVFVIGLALGLTLAFIGVCWLHIVAMLIIATS
jgi:hypothetical protein